MTAPASDPVVTAIIATRNRPESLRRAVESVLACDGPPLELIVVDQSDEERLSPDLAGCHPRLRYLRTEPRGKGAALNIALRQARGSLLAFTDDDTRVPRSWLTDGMAALERVPEAGLMFGEVRIPPELVELERGGMDVPCLYFPRQTLVNGGRPFHVGGMGACLFVRRGVMDRIGPFDEMLCIGGPLLSSEDFDLTMRAHRLGVSTLLEPEVWVDHFAARPPEESNQRLRAYGYGDGAFWMKFVRLGTPVAAKELAARLGIEVARLPVRRIRRRSSRREYLLGIIEGMRASWRYGIDRRSGVYLPREARG